MDNAPARARGTQDITVVWVVFVLAVLGLIAAYWFLLLKPKNEEIQMTQASIASKESTFTSYKKEAEELLNYEDKFAALVHQWNKNQHYFVNGLVWDAGTRRYQEPYKGREQWAIFDTLLQVWSAGAFAGVLITEMWISEDLEFYLDDEPFEVPDELKGAVDWKPIMSHRGENPNPLFTSHNFSIKFYGNLQQTRRFIEVVQKLEQENMKIFSVHCFENSGAPMYRANIVGRGDVILTDVAFEMNMSMSVYELNPHAKTANTPPDIPGTASCSY
ncbi:MAG TPA: hypothetical protein ENN67_05980, partial [Firmicutes bacterium]|nr:hypothetical protein [Bacillota bacterium]